MTAMKRDQGSSPDEALLRAGPDERSADFDLRLLSELREDLGEDSFGPILDACVSDISLRLEKLAEFCARRRHAAQEGREPEDLATARALAHQLKGLFMQFGATAAAGDARKLESCEAAALEARVTALHESGARAVIYFGRQRPRRR